jgi:hypothetical protein
MEQQLLMITILQQRRQSCMSVLFNLFYVAQVCDATIAAQRTTAGIILFFKN